MAKTNLRQAVASANVLGILAEKNLKEEMVNSRGVIRGDLVIKTSEDNYVKFNVFVNQYKSDGNGSYTNEENKIYRSMKTIIEDYHPVSEEGIGVENATLVEVDKGQIRPDTYFDERGKHETLKYQSNFFNRPKHEVKPEDFKAEFEIELFISALTPEMVKDEDGDMVESGRLIVKGWMPTYNGIEPIDLIAPIEDGIAEAIQDSYELGQTVEFYGNLVNTRKVTIQEIPVKIGKPKRKEITTYKNELIITGATEPYEEDGAVSAYNVEAIRAAIADRELVLAEKEKKAKEKKTGSTVGSQKPKPSGRSLPLF